jgi:hypothetical protein
MKRTSTLYRRVRKLVLIGISLVLLLGALGFARARYDRWLTANFIGPVGLKKQEAERIVALIKDGKLRPRPNGAIDLPADLASVTTDGTVYVTHARRGQLLILFIAGYGWDGDFVGMLYSNGPVPQKTLQEVRLTVNGPWTTIVGEPRDERPHPRIIEGERINADWYWVETP